MSDTEEPPTKVTRYEMSSQFLEGEVEADGQEEWLSEGILTDDDAAAAEQDHSTSNLDTSQDGTMASIDNSLEHLTDSQEATDGQNTSAEVSTNGQNVSINAQNVSINGQNASISGQKVSTVKNANLNLRNASVSINVTTQGRAFVVDGTKVTVGRHTQDFEKELKNMEESQHIEADFPEDLNAFLIRKKDGKIVTGNPKLCRDADKQSDIEESPRHSGEESDGNDTDGLIRLLGDDGVNNKKYQDDDETADEEDFNLEGAQIKTLKVADNASIKQYSAPKAMPEDDDITDASSDEGEVMKKIFQRKVTQPSKVNPPPATVPKSTRVQPKRMQTSTPVKQYAVKRVQEPKVSEKAGQNVKTFHVTAGTSLLGVTVKNPVPVTKVAVSSGPRAPQATKGPFHGIGKDKQVVKKIVSQPPAAPSVQRVKLKTEPAKAKPEESDDEEVPLKSVAKKEKQPIMRPEEMDEEMLSDTASETDEETLYDELPSSEDEDLHEWFTLDIRAERAGDYIPLLGDRAEKLLLEERRRVTTRLANLRKSLSVLTETSRQQADKLRAATAELAELDAQIKAA